MKKLNLNICYLFLVLLSGCTTEGYVVNRKVETIGTDCQIEFLDSDGNTVKAFTAVECKTFVSGTLWYKMPEDSVGTVYKGNYRVK